MSPPFVISTLWLVCMLAAATFGARPFARLLDPAWLVAPFGAALLAMRWLAPEPGWVGLILALAAAWPLVRPLSDRAGWALAGLCSALAASLYAAQGVELWLIAPACLAVALAAAWLARNKRFAPLGVRQAVWVGIVWLAPMLAAARGVMDGWRSAETLNKAAESVAVRPLPAWTWAFVAGALVLGLLHAYWIRRR